VSKQLYSVLLNLNADVLIVLEYK